MEPFSQQFAQRMPEQPKDKLARSVPPRFDAKARACLYDLLRWRRDVRRFEGTPLPEGTVERLIGIRSA